MRHVSASLEGPPQGTWGGWQQRAGRWRHEQTLAVVSSQLLHLYLLHHRRDSDERLQARDGDGDREEKGDTIGNSLSP